MEQMDLFEETLSKKIYRMEKWVSRIQKEIWFLKEVNLISRKRHPSKNKEETIDMFVV